MTPWWPSGPGQDWIYSIATDWELPGGCPGCGIATQIGERVARFGRGSRYAPPDWPPDMQVSWHEACIDQGGPEPGWIVEPWPNAEPDP
jgi:hypothetical protein